MFIFFHFIHNQMKIRLSLLNKYVYVCVCVGGEPKHILNIKNKNLPYVCCNVDLVFVPHPVHFQNSDEIREIKA